MSEVIITDQDRQDFALALETGAIIIESGAAYACLTAIGTEISSDLGENIFPSESLVLRGRINLRTGIARGFEQPIIFDRPFIALIIETLQKAG